jgi:hypothetical protein
MTISTSKLATRQSALPVVANEIATQLDLTAKNASYAFSIATKDSGSVVAALNLAGIVFVARNTSYYTITSRYATWL